MVPVELSLLLSFKVSYVRSKAYGQSSWWASSDSPHSLVNPPLDDSYYSCIDFWAVGMC